MVIGKRDRYKMAHGVGLGWNADWGRFSGFSQVFWCGAGMISPSLMDDSEGYYRLRRWNGNADWADGL